ncbi:MAG: S-layer homology domain-containing protein [Lachnospirales bacterium]
MVKKSISKILSAVLATAMVCSSFSVFTFAKPDSWAMGFEDEKIKSYTVSEAKAQPSVDVPVKIFNNTDTENYTVYVNYNPAELMVTGATAGAFSLSTEDLMSKSVNHTPAAGNPSFAGKGADGVKTEAELGRVKFAYSSSVAGKAAAADSELTAFNLTFKVVAPNPVVGNKYYINLTYDDAVLYGSDNVTNSTNVANGYIEITATQGGSTGGGGGGGGSIKTTTTTTTTTVATEATTTEKEDQTVETTKKSISVVIDTPNGPITINPPTERDPEKGNYTDLDNYPWAKDSIQKLSELGILSGIGDGLFGPGLPCKRCDFAIIINRVLGIDVEITKNFTDNVDQSKYYYNDCAMGYSAGILSGYGDNNYKPENYCTREEMFVLTAKTLEYLGEDVTSTSLDVNNKYSDVADISWWSAPYCAFLTDVGIVNGNADGTCNPDSYITRAEMAVMMDKDYEYAYEVLQRQLKTAEEANKEILEEGAFGETTHVDDNGQTLIITQELLVEMSAKLTEYADALAEDGAKLTGDAKTEFDEASAEVKVIAEKVLTEIAEGELDDVNSDILGTATRLYELANNNKFAADFQTGFDEIKALGAEGVQKN